jgi:hypothetical protein
MVVYATSDDFTDGSPNDDIVEQLREAVAQAQRLSGAL